MASRRDVLKAGFAAAVLPAAARASVTSRATVPLHAVLHDTRFAAGVAFARRARARGLSVHGIEGDMTRFWYDDLYHAWKREPVAIAGLTAHGALFCLERLAWEQRLRVVYRGEHARAADGSVAHRFVGCASFVSMVAEGAAAPAWAAALADAVADCPRDRAAPRTIQSSTFAPATAPAAEALFSWVIAPVSRV